MNKLDNNTDIDILENIKLKRNKWAIADEHYKRIKINLLHKTSTDTLFYFNDKDDYPNYVDIVQINDYEEIVPNDIDKYIIEAMSLKCFDSFDIIAPSNNLSDPILVGRINKSNQYWIIKYWNCDENLKLLID